VQVAARPGLGGEVEYGRIAVTSTAVARGYLPESPRGDLRDGTFLTSDLGRLDAQGRVHLNGRVDRLINVGGRKVNPAEVEAVIQGLPGVRQVVVLGTPDRQRGQAVTACVVASKGVTREAILAACREHLAPFKIPRRIEFAARIPVNARGKTDRLELSGLMATREAPGPHL